MSKKIKKSQESFETSPSEKKSAVKLTGEINL